MHSPSHPTRACPAQNNPYTTSSRAFSTFNATWPPYRCVRQCACASRCAHASWAAAWRTSAGVRAQLSKKHHCNVVEKVSNRQVRWTGTRANVFFSHCLCCSGLASTKSLTCARIFWKLLWPSSSFLPSLQDAMPSASSALSAPGCSAASSTLLSRSFLVSFLVLEPGKALECKTLGLHTHTVCACVRTPIRY